MQPIPIIRQPNHRDIDTTAPILIEPTAELEADSVHAPSPHHQVESLCAFLVGERMALPCGEEEHHANVICETGEFERFLE